MNTCQTIHQNTADMHYSGPDRHGNQITIDAAELSPGCFEVAVLRSDGLDIENKQAASRKDAEKIYNDLFRRYVLPKKPLTPLSGKYAQLRDDLKKALEAGRAAENADPEDGGACNHDSASLALPRWSAAKVEQAAKEAGISCFTWSLFGSRRFVFTPDTRSYANARSRNAEAMTAALRSMGYDAMDYCQMD